MRRGRRSLTPSANPHVKTARRKALLVTSPGPQQEYLQFCCSWVVVASPCSNFTPWSLRKRKEAGKTPYLWHISELARWLQLLFMISVGGDSGTLCLSPRWFPLQLLSEIYAASSGLIKYNFLPFSANHSRCTCPLSAGSHCRQYLNSSWWCSPSSAPAATATAVRHRESSRSQENDIKGQ